VFGEEGTQWARGKVPCVEMLQFIYVPIRYALIPVAVELMNFHHLVPVFTEVIDDTIATFAGLFLRIKPYDLRYDPPRLDDRLVCRHAPLLR
jgi:hypothetical protein